MEYRKLGSTGLDVSRICLGCMSFGDPARGNHPWTMPEDDARPMIAYAVEQGITFFDTANSYSDGSSEEIVGRALKDFARRDEVVVATKVYFSGRTGPNTGGLSRKNIMREIDGSLQRLGMDHVDLYQIHRWDYGTPIEETLEALDDVVKAGKARYIGASSMFAWQFAKALYTADLHGWTRFVSMQDHYNLLHREEEREMHGLCADQGIGVIPWSPLARGRLTRDWAADSARTGSDPLIASLYAADDERIVRRVADIAAARGVPRAQVALAWILSKPVVTAPLVGVTKIGHIDDAVAALDLTLTDDEIASLEEPYTPRPIAGFQ
ncbi:aldo/keto reductase [Nakamurella sp. GG22]